MRRSSSLRVTALILSLGSVAIPAAILAKTPPARPHVKNVVLVHGAWADGAGWQGVYKILVKDGYTVSVVTHSNESLASDVDDTKRVLDRQDGPVILVGHSYGGAIITETGGDPKVVGLVYIAAFMPDVGESALGMYPKGSPSPPVDMGKDGVSFFKRDAYFAAFAPELPKPEVDFMFASQVPFALQKAGLAPVSTASWKTKPSWFLLSKDDKLVPPALARMMAERAKSTIVEISGSHTAFIAHPAAAAKLIEQAAEAEAK